MKILLILLTLLLICGAVLAAFLCGLRQASQAAEPQITGDLLASRLRSVQELVTVSYYYTNMGRFENQVDFYGWKVPFTTKSFIVSYDGVIKAGIDLGGVTIDVDEASRTITVTLPPSTITDNNIPQETINVLEVKNGLFNEVTIDDYNALIVEEKRVMEEKAVEIGLLTDADSEARAIVRAFLELLPGMDTYTLIVK